MTSVLIVEDNDDNMELISLILEHQGYLVTKAYTGQQGIDLAQQFNPEVAIIDYMLPDMNGREVARKINHATTGKIPAICMTALAMPGDREAILSSGFCGYIEKPINPGTVVIEIINILGHEFENIYSR